MFDFIVGFRNIGFFAIVLLALFLMGCTSTAEQSQKFVSEGSGGPMPPPGTRVMILSNHKGAQSGAAEWLQQRGFLVVDQSRVEKELTDSAGHVPSGGQRNLQIREVAKAVDAEMVVSTHVGRKFVPADYGSQAMTIASVEIQGMDVQTGNVAFESKAWNSDPVVASEGTVLSLTKGALQQAWKGEDRRALAPIEVVAQERSPALGVVESRSAEREKTNALAQVEVVAKERSPVPGVVESPSADREKTDALAPSEVVAQERSPAPGVVESPSGGREKSEVAPSPQASANSSGVDSGDRESSLGLQVASGALSILYTPMKVIYAGLGGIIGGLAYVVTAGNGRVAQNIWDVSLAGDYWVTPAHLEGNKPLHFQGQSITVDVAN